MPFCLPAYPSPFPPVCIPSCLPDFLSPPCLGSRNSSSVVDVGRVEATVAEIGDLLYYCNDAMNAGVPALSQVVADHLLSIWLHPVLLASLSETPSPPAPDCSSAARAEKESGDPRAAEGRATAGSSKDVSVQAAAGLLDLVRAPATMSAHMAGSPEERCLDLLFIVCIFLYGSGAPALVVATRFLARAQDSLVLVIANTCSNIIFHNRPLWMLKLASPMLQLASPIPQPFPCV